MAALVNDLGPRTEVNRLAAQSFLAHAMALFDFLKRLFGAPAEPNCPHCGLSYSWNGRRCSHCHYPNHERASTPASTEGRDYARMTSPTGEVVSAGIPRTATFDPTTLPDDGNVQNKPVSSALAGLDTDKFAPISNEEALLATQSTEWKTAYLDPMNVIPSAELPRVQVIDRTMVGMGLISAEELAEIHKIGKEYEKYRQDGSVILEAGQRAVQQSKEAKRRLKQQKQDEAAARKKAHAEAVAHRHATDIFYLGRGVSKGLADRRSHVEKLTSQRLAALATPEELAKAMNLTIPRLRWLAFHSEAAKQAHYIQFTIPKKSGGVRKVAAPHKEMASAQRWILDHVLRELRIHVAAHGFQPGRSIVTNAEPHVGADVLVNVDLKDFFPSLTFWRVEGLFRSLGYSPAVATILALLCTECPRETVKLNGQTYHVATGPRCLPQGACTSPAISNLIARHLDHRLFGMAKKLGWNYSRYADDISFSASGDAATCVGYALARIRHIAQDEGFAVNEKKTRVLRNHAQQSVTGIVVNDHMSVSRKTVRQLRAILHNAKKSGLESQNRDGHENFAEWLQGMISYVEMVNAGSCII